MGGISIVQEQRVAGQGAFTTAPLSAEAGETIEYRFLVKNQEGAAVQLSPLDDPQCSDIAPAGATELQAGETESISCEHTVLAADGPEYLSTGTVEVDGETFESNQVSVSVEESSFTITKRQAIDDGPFTQGNLVATAGQTVEYEIVVEDTGSTTLALNPLSDPHCAQVEPSGPVALGPGRAQFYFCEHLLTAADKPEYDNVATIVGNGKEEGSNAVAVKVETQGFSISTEQRLTGQFTGAELTGSVGQVVSYLTTVTNTGEVAEALSALHAAGCTDLMSSRAPVTGSSEEVTIAKEELRFDEEELREDEEEVAEVEAELLEARKLLHELEVNHPSHRLEIEEAREEVVADEEYLEQAKEFVAEAVLFVAEARIELEEAEASAGTDLNAGESETFSCEHELTVSDKPRYSLAPTIVGNGESMSADPVLVRVIGSPGVGGEVASEVGKTEATLGAAVDPEGAEVSECRFEYGTSSGPYEASLPCSTPLGDGETALATSVTAKGLVPNTIYHFRVVAANAGGTTDGKDTTFKTLPVTPTVSGGLARDITQTGATLAGAVNPNGGEVTECWFEYGATEGYGARQPCASLPGAGIGPVEVAGAVTGLVANHSYDYRLAATNSGGTSYGPNETFRTLPDPPTVETGDYLAAPVATLTGAVIPNGGEVTACGFEYGNTRLFGHKVACTTLPGGGEEVVEVAAEVAGLAPGETYHFRIFATNSGGTSFGSEQTFKAESVAPPVVTRISPKTGPAAGGTPVMISGSGFSDDATVRFGLVEAASVKVISSTALVAVTPPEAIGSVNVTVTTPGGTSTLTRKARFNYKRR